MSPPGFALRTTFSAASFASAPEFPNSTLPPSEDADSRSARSAIGRVMNRLETWISSPAWARIAATTSGWQWPVLQTEIPARKSRYSSPSASHSRAPSPRTNSTGNRA